MPGGDGTGPLGKGSMTGRALGHCVGYSKPGFQGRIRFERGFGRRIWGRGRGFWNNPYPKASYNQYDQPKQIDNMYLSKNEEKEVLLDTIDGLEQRIEYLKKRMQELTDDKKEWNRSITWFNSLFLILN